MEKSEIEPLLKELVDLPMQYANKLWKLKDYSLDDIHERVHLHTHQGKSYDRPYDGIVDFLDQLEPIKPISNLPKVKLKYMNDLIPNGAEDITTPKTFADLREILMDNIGKLQRKQITIGEAKEVANQAQTVVNIAKLELEYAKTMKK